jgi:hypothetical protein
MIRAICHDGVERDLIPILHKYVKLGFNPDLINHDTGRLRIDINPKYKGLSFRDKVAAISVHEDASCITHYSKYSRGLNSTFVSIRDVIEVGAYYWFSPCLSIESNMSTYRDDGIFIKMLKFVTRIFLKKKNSIMDDMTLNFINKATTATIYKLKDLVSHNGGWVLLFESEDGAVYPIELAILGCPNLVYSCRINQ